MNEAHRRPIAARSLRPVVAAADYLVRHGASANGISLAGMGAAIAAGLAFASTREWPAAAVALWLAGALLVQGRLMANMLDGMVAIGRGAASPTGELFNEVPDRVSDCAILIGLGWGIGQLALGLFAALGAVATAYIRAIGKGMGQPSDFSGPMAKQQRMAVVTAVAVWCALAPARWSAGWPEAALWVIAGLSFVTAALRLRAIARRLPG